MAKQFTRRNHTLATMLYCDGTGKAYYGVFRAKVSFKTPHEWTWNLHKATQVGGVMVEHGAQRPSYFAMASRFATSDFPAFGSAQEEVR